MRIKKKNTRGNARNFMTRTQAVKKLQVSLADFRRLCIFKGIYPREPRNKKKANKGSTAPTTFYYYKDIQYLMHEPVLAKFREHKTFAKKLTKALGRGQVSAAKKLEENRSTYKLDHIIRERYPSFPDALRDIDDALNMIFLFANLPATDRVSARIIRDAQKISNQWLAYVAKERLLRKVFVSIKGVYYQADVRGEEIRWVVPFKFPENIPNDIDFRIMLTFLEFYCTLLHFVLYKLYTESGLVYPPKIDAEKDKIISGLASFILESQGAENTLSSAQPAPSNSETRTLDSATLKAALQTDSEVAKDDQEEEEAEKLDTVELDKFEDNNKNKGDELEQPSQFDSPISTLFSGFVFYVGREVPIDIAEFLILSCGGSVISEAGLDQLEGKEDLDLSKVTHQIIDRRVIKNRSDRTYVQPQWIFDCINKGTLVPTNTYLPGEPLPPHLSPWGDASGYDPTAASEEDDEEEESESDNEVEIGEEEEKSGNEAGEEEVAAEESEEEDEDLQAQKELELEATGVSYSKAKESDGNAEKVKKSKKRKAPNEDEEEKRLKMIMMSNKQRKLYKKMQYSNNKKDERIENLKKKKKEISRTKKKAKKSEK
ncbi:NOP7 (YGR103W) [Zygosaccharomyces parabailii]|nr:NOP7 (YGR103W) [Zygosaccharomyces parabailii]